MYVSRFAKIYGIPCLPISSHDHPVWNVELQKKGTSHCNILATVHWEAGR